jgi:hypothetical protein
MNELTLHYVNQAERERTIAEDLRNRQILASSGQAVGTAERSVPAATPANSSAPTATAAARTGTPATRPQPAPIPARAAGR